MPSYMSFIYPSHLINAKYAISSNLMIPSNEYNVRTISFTIFQIFN